MKIANCRLMGLASRPQLPPLDVRSVIIMIIIVIESVSIRSIFRLIIRSLLRFLCIRSPLAIPDFRAPQHPQISAASSAFVEAWGSSRSC